MTQLKKQRPEFRNINALKDLTTYRLPPAGWVSIQPARGLGFHPASSQRLTDVHPHALHHLDVR